MKHNPPILQPKGKKRDRPVFNQEAWNKLSPLYPHPQLYVVLPLVMDKVQYMKVGTTLDPVDTLKHLQSQVPPKVALGYYFISGDTFKQPDKVARDYYSYVGTKDWHCITPRVIEGLTKFISESLAKELGRYILS